MPTEYKRVYTDHIFNFYANDLKLKPSTSYTTPLLAVAPSVHSLLKFPISFLNTADGVPFYDSRAKLVCVLNEN